MKALLAAALVAALALSSRAESFEINSAAAVGQLGEPLDSFKRSMQGPRQLFEIVDGPTPKDGDVTDAVGGKRLRIRKDQFGQVYLMAATLDHGTGENGVFAGEEWGQAFNYAWYLQRSGKRVLFMHKRLDHRAAPGSPEEKAIAASFQDEEIASVGILSEDAKTHDITINARDLFLKDLANLAQRLKKAYPNDEYKDIKISPDDSELHSLAAMPKNLEASVQLSFIKSNGLSNSTGNKLTVRVHYSLCARPDGAGFEPREADPRVGYFTEEFRDYSKKDLKLKGQPIVELIQRWNLQKTDPNAAISDVKNPIVWWIDGSVPNEYRQYVKAGILAWNQAFEAVGLRNALVVKEVDKDMSEEERKAYNPSDVSYNVVRWLMGDEDGFAEAPSRSDPLTGQIFSARIRIGDGMSRNVEADTAVAAPKGDPSGARVDDDARIAQQAAAGLALLESRGPLSAEEKTKFLGQYLTWMVLHETGHTLGLRHNFKAGGMLALADIGKQEDLTSSGMNYPSPNLAAAGQPQGAYFQTRPGPYDKWAVEYGYAPLPGQTEMARKEDLKRIADRSSADPRLAYGTDEDVTGADPDAQRFTLGNDAIAYAESRTALADGLLKRLEPGGEPDAYVRLRRDLSAGFNEYVSAAQAVAPVIAGVRSRRVAPGASTPPFEPVPAAEQRRALAFLDKKIFSPDAFSVRPDLLQRAAKARADDGGAAPFSVPEFALEAQRAALDHIYARPTLRRLSDNVQLYARPQDAITTSDVFTSVQRSIWKEIGTPKAAPIGPLRRTLQREHLEDLVSVLSSAKAPGDARAEARRDLKLIDSEAERALASKKLDQATRSHLKDVRARIDDAFKNNGDVPAPAGK